VFSPGDHGTTYGGQPLAASAARATLSIMERINAPQLAEHAGARLRRLLETVDGVVEVRGLGLLLAAQLAEGIDARAAAADLLARGLIVNAVSPSALRFAPPLIVSESEIVEAVELVSAVLAEHLGKEQS
jgi:acetylornithine/N-succinyldiaminopimelate aminotransferase